LELAATMPGEPLYAASGFAVTERFELTLSEGITVPLAVMRRSIDALEGFSVVPTTTAAQIEGYNRCVDRIARERRYFGIIEGPPLDTSADFVEAARARRGVHLVALDANDVVVGWCDVARHVRPGFDHCGRLGMGLLPDVRGLGLGERLLRAALDAAAQQDFERVELEVFASNANAHALYLRLGFIEEGRKRGARKLDGVYDDDVLMVRWLVPQPMPPHAYASPAPRSP
jgi:RimJ/RimL family protein N-acetyltransferase